MARKGENIYRRKDNRWEGRYICKHDSDGTARYGYCYGVSYQDVRRKIAERKAAIRANEGRIAPGKRRFAYYCDEWLQLSRDRVKESTYNKYQSVLNLHVRPRLGHYPVKCLTTVEIERFSHALLYEENLSPKTVRDILIMLHSILKYTSRQHPLPMQLVQIPYPKDVRKEMRVLTRTEQARLIDFLLRGRDETKFGVLLALLTGLRIGELCALRWRDVSLDERIIRVSATLQRLKVPEEDNDLRRTRIVISEPKSDNSARIIPLTDMALELCKRYYVREPEAFVLTGCPQHLEPRTLQYRFQKYAFECRLEDVHFHTLRHTFATRCVEVEFEIKSLSEILGHSNPRITLERYVHSSVELKRDNMEKLADAGY